MRLTEYLRWSELHIQVTTHELFHLVLAVGHGPNRYVYGSKCQSPHLQKYDAVENLVTQN